MSKHNGKRNGVEKYHINKPDMTLMQDGISIVAAGDADQPSEVHLYCKVPDAEFAYCFSFWEPELLTDFIEGLIAYRRLVFPDAPEINTNAGKDGKE